MKQEFKLKAERIVELERELEKQTGKANELEKELKDKETKFLDLYHENSGQHDKILELTHQLEAEVSTYEVLIDFIERSIILGDARRRVNKSKES